jgi:putative membrane protein
VSSLAATLPAVNATLNGLSGVLLLAGWVAIRRGARGPHRALMLGAFSTSALFLVGYLTRVALTGVHRFPGSGLEKALYLSILGSHTLLAVACAPLALVTLYLALRAKYPVHRKVARVTLPIWLYVSATGVAVYVFLYHLATPPLQ